jgi:hypothetical protein
VLGAAGATAWAVKRRKDAGAGQDQEPVEDDE